MISKGVIVSLLFSVSTMLSAIVVRADAFDEKARAVAAQQEQAAESKAYTASIKALNSNNSYMVRRIPRGASITECFNLYAFYFRKESNGCRLANIQWNNIPVQICTEGYNQNLPPEIVECHYHVEKTGQDCEIVRNASIKPRCY